MSEEKRPRPVLDPAIPAADRELLTGPAAPLVAAGLPAPVAPRLDAAKIIARIVWIPAFAFFYGVLPGGWITLFFLTSIEEDDLMGGVLRWGRLPVFAMMVTPLVQIMLILLGFEEMAVTLAAASFGGWAIGALRHLGEPPAARAAREHHGRYLLPADFDRPAARLLTRAQRAIDTVLSSKAHQAGLLDSVENGVTLPQQEWEIATALAEHTHLRRERRLQQPDRLSEPVRALLEPQRHALNLSIRSVTRRIEALEAYAGHTKDADDAYHEWQVLQRLPEQNARYQELLAGTVRDDLAQDHLTHLTAQARQAESTLRDNITAALQAGRALADPDHT